LFYFLTSNVENLEGINWVYKVSFFTQYHFQNSKLNNWVNDLGKDVKSMKGKKVPLKFYIYADDIVELKQEDWDIDFIEEFEDHKDARNESESYVINDYITLKFERGTTQIYINGKKFIQCIRLIIHIPYDDVEKYDEIKSIDDAIEIYKKRSRQIDIVEGPGARAVQESTYRISPKEEFRGHCSKRFEMGDNKFRNHLRILGYLKFLTREELITLEEVARAKYNENTNRYEKPREKSKSSNAIYNFVSYFVRSKHLYDANKRGDFISSCNQTLFKLYQDSFRNKNKSQSKNEVTNHILKRKILLRELKHIKSEMHIPGKLIEFLKTLEVLIIHLDPDVVEAQLDSFKMPS